MGILVFHAKDQISTFFVSKGNYISKDTMPPFARV